MIGAKGHWLIPTDKAYTAFGDTHTLRDSSVRCTDKKVNKIFLIYKEIQMGSGAKSYMRKGFLIYEEMHKSFTMYVEAVSHI